MDGGGYKNNILRTNKFPSPKEPAVNSGDLSNKPALLCSKGKTKPSPPFRPCGRGAMQLSKAISQSQLLSNSSSESTPTNWVFCFGNPPCYAKVLAFPSNNDESVYIQPMKQSPFDKKLLTLWEGHTWLAKQNKLIPVEMVQKPGGWQVVNDSRVQKIIDMVDNKGCAFAYPTNINHVANSGIDKCDMISLESSEVGEMNVVLPLLPNQGEKNSSNIEDSASQKEKLPSLISHNTFPSSSTSNSSNFPMETFSRPKLRRPNHSNHALKNSSNLTVNASSTMSQCDDTSTIISPTITIPAVENSANDLISTSLLALSQISSNIQCIDSQTMIQYDIDDQNLADPVDILGESPPGGSANSGSGDVIGRSEVLMFTCGGIEEVMNSQESFQSPTATIGAVKEFHKEVPVQLSHERPNYPQVSESSTTACDYGGEDIQMKTDDSVKVSKDVDIEVAIDSSFDGSSQAQVEAMSGIECDKPVSESKLISPICSQATMTSKESSQATTPPSVATDNSISFVSSDDYQKITCEKESTSLLVDMGVHASTVGAEDSFLSPESSARTAKEFDSDAHTGTETAPHSEVSRTIGKHFSTVSDISISESPDSVSGSPDTGRDATTSVCERRSGIRTRGRSSKGVAPSKRRQTTIAPPRVRSNAPAEVSVDQAPDSRNMSREVETSTNSNGKRRRVDRGNEVSATSTMQDAAASTARTKRTTAQPKYAVLGSWPSSKQCAASGNWFIR